MRVYFEKPRTTVGWKGLINDPHMDNSFKINEGLRTARELLLRINELGLPAGTEYPRHDQPAVHRRPDLVGAIGARDHRVASAPRTRVGTVVPGRLQERHRRQREDRRRRNQGRVAAAPFPCRCTKGGHSAIVSTAGNEDCHIILRGGKAPNYDAESVNAACIDIGKAGLAARLMIDAKPREQLEEAREPDSGAARTSAGRLLRGRRHELSA